MFRIVTDLPGDDDDDGSSGPIDIEFDIDMPPQREPFLLDEDLVELVLNGTLVTRNATVDGALPHTTHHRSTTVTSMFLFHTM